MVRSHFGLNYFALTMRIAFIFVAGVIFNSVQCYDSESLEYNGIEVSPLYETIIYSDIADIINEFQNNNVAFDKANNESESDEDVEDLLSEYHHYLEKAHKQRVNYLEKNKPKNKVPVVRHEKFSKMLSSAANKHNYKNNLYNSDHKFTKALNPFNMFIPFKSDKYLTTSEPPTYSNDLSVFKKMILTDENPIPSFSSIPVKSSCFCKDGRSSCKQCFVPLDHMQPINNPNTFFPADEDKPYALNNPLFTEKTEKSDDSINVRIKVDVQLPKLQQVRIQPFNLQSRDKTSDNDFSVSKEYVSAINLPSPYFNFPIPMNLFGYKKMSTNNKLDANPIHKITIHKKKKSKAGYSNKKHRKKVITFHNIKIEPQLYQNHFGMFNFSISSKNETENNNTVILNLRFNKTQIKDTNYTTMNPAEYLNVSETQTEENILLLVNITNSIENVTNEKHKTENSIETEYTNVISNATTDKPLHVLRKREILSPVHQNKSGPSQTKNTTPKNISLTQKKSTKLDNTPQKKEIIIRQSPIIKKKTVTKNKTLQQRNAKKNTTEIKLDKEKSNTIKLEKSLLIDTELLYWPIANANKTKIAKNITTIILENENKKAKLNMSAGTLRSDHTRALEQAIFGNVDWNDVDAVAPAFISFVGKYLEGILTFCNERICHSMKCTKKKCLHRFCEPKDRFNNKGHCTGSNYTESEASMESIMDLPSKIVFEIVDILQDRMVGKMFGKATLCINSKCITFAASKKIFHKTRCTAKELSPKGHCVN